MTPPAERKTPAIPSAAIFRSFLLYFLPVSLAIGAISFLFYQGELRARTFTLQDGEKFGLEQQQSTLKNQVRSIVSDLLILATHHEIRTIMADQNIPPEEDWQAVAIEFFAFARFKKIYDQVRFLDRTGMEVVRINYHDGQPEIVPRENLRFQGDRPYFQDTVRLNRGEIFVSPLSLDIENGAMEMPLKPMIRFGCPVFGPEKEKTGAVILNFMGAEFLNELARLSENTRGGIMLLNGEGYWLLSPDRNDEWGFMFQDKKELTFGNRFPGAWKEITAADAGQFTNSDGMFTFTTVRPLLEGLRVSNGSPAASAESAAALKANDYYWKLVSYIPAQTLKANLHPSLALYLLGNAFLFLAAGAGCWLAAHGRIERRQAELELKKSEQKFRTLADFTYDWESWLGNDGAFIYVSPSCERFCGYTPEDFYRNPQLAFDIIHPEDRDMYLQHTGNERQAHEVISLDFRIIDKKGAELWIAHTCRPVYGPAGELLGRRTSNRDITQRVIAEQKLKKLASHDTLTGLPNRHLLFDRLTQALARSRRSGKMTGILFLDLDKFKEINDELGHEAGDAVLCETARRMKKQVREEDTVARMGGDEFIIVLHDLPGPEQAGRIARKLLDAVSMPIELAEGNRVVEASVGISMFPADGDEPNALISKADTAMYAAKTEGRNCFRFAGG